MEVSKIQPKAFANAAASVTVIVFLFCLALVAIAPDLAFSLFSLTFHGINPEPLRPSTVNLDFMRAVVGGIVLAVEAWLVFYLGAYLYNKFRKG